ncbi:transcription factor CAULIFLOWER A-like protein [Carex littledalei]|uniref:Transcription factor CAULIFLOWER A-like protein n=1 Tax=Carex littledalei TaxID=544730 RepID=A0A833QR67_9POAL|nr:transcription factor CAULIFLOWER A-like protein [Carex littledalei]
MMRGRVELKRIENKACRQVSFSRRRCGLMKKAHELSVLCDADVGLIIFSPKGKLYEFSSSNCMEKIIEKYTRFSDAEKGVNKRSVRLSADSGTKVEVPKFLQRLIDGSDFPKLNLDEFNQMENKLVSALATIMSRKQRDLQISARNEIITNSTNPRYRNAFDIEFHSSSGKGTSP